jgi:type 1 glutamine amidotransferase
MWFAEDNHDLLKTDADSSDGPVAYVRDYAAARVCTIQLGHDAHAFNNAGFQKLLSQAIQWTAKAKK